ncbi:MAG TPA: hypothetical protein DCQ98_03020 [Planctomycetaceae bacterium]|nr:hypothetical protein [Planctomycetaceae bacterium]HRE98927.1 hypothetical protein [Pirellulaceae bacterium]
MIRLARNILLAVCTATILLQAGVLAKTWADGFWKTRDPYRLMAIVYGIDATAIAEMRREIAPVRTFELLGADERERIAQGRVLDFDMRERSIATAVDDLQHLIVKLDEERQRYERLRIDFETQFERIEGVAQDADLARLRDTLGSIDAVQAKDQIMTLLQRADDSSDVEIANDVVVLIKTMPMDKRRRILSEFRTDAERRRLAFIMRELRLGNPEIPLIRSTGERLREFDPPDPQDST